MLSFCDQRRAAVNGSREVTLDRSRGLRAILRKPSRLDWVRIGLLVAGVLCVLTGLLPPDEAQDNIRRIAPLTDVMPTGRLTHQ